MEDTVISRFLEIRTKNGLNQKEFAESLGVSQSMVSDIERGKRGPSRQILAVLAKKYQVNLNWFLLGIGKDTLQNIEEKPEIESLKKENQELKKTVENLDLEIQALNKELLLRLRQLVDTPGSCSEPRHA